MIKITDMTLSCLDPYSATSEQLKRIAELLIEIKVDFIELTPAVYRKMGSLDDRAKYVLRIHTPDEAGDYPEFTNYVCRLSGIHVPPNVTVEMQLNDLREAYQLSRFAEAENIRIVGLDDLILHDYTSAFQLLKSKVKGRVEFCPENRYGFATSLAVEWILQGGTELATSFGGLCQKAPLEEVLLALRVAAHYKPRNEFNAFPELRELIETITSERFSGMKPVIGHDIFNVESGIHVDGIYKRQQIYEPFTPELVGNQRKVIIGKHSGLKSIAVKLEEGGRTPEQYDMRGLLERVKDLCSRSGKSLSDAEFFKLSHQFFLKKG